MTCKIKYLLATFSEKTNLAEKVKKVVLVTGSAGFIGYHVAKRYLDAGYRVIGVDCISDYYDVSLKLRRQSMLLQNPAFMAINEKIETPSVLHDLFIKEKPDIVIHLAAQAGVRYSIENPRSYLESNIVGTFELLEAARANPPEHMLMASTSSAYGANEIMPYKEVHKADHQMSFYAATKKSTENMAHSYSHLFGLPITMFRFFTVYGPWGRPDMALFKFTKAILDGQPIDIFNNGDMSRDFTYISDLVECIYLLSQNIPNTGITNPEYRFSEHTLSRVAPFRVVNIGNSNPVKLMQFIEVLEELLNLSAQKNYLPMQAGDVYATWADPSYLQHLTGYVPTTTIRTGTSYFIDWYRSYYSK